MKVNTQISGDYYRAYKSTSKVNQKGAFTMAPAKQYGDNSTASGQSVGGSTVSDSKTKNERSNQPDASDMIKMIKEIIMEEHKLTAENIKNEDDWRYMSDEQWDKQLEKIDKYIDKLKEDQEKIEEIRKEAVMKAAACAPAAMKAEAMSKAALIATTNGIVGARVPDKEARDLEKLSWTYDLQTEDQTILAIAKMANEFASYILSKAQELALTGDTSVGRSENVIESTLLDEDEEKITITE